MDVEELNKGDVVKGPIYRTSNSGNGIIELSTGHINVGRVKNRSVGTIVEAVITGESFDTGLLAVCLDESVRLEGYEESHPQLDENHREGSLAEDLFDEGQTDPITVGKKSC